MFFLIAPLLLVALAVVFQAWGTWLDGRRFRAPGEFAGGVHLQQQKNGRPSVIFEAGLAATSLSWVLTQAETGRFATSVSYDRAGLGFSPPSAAELSLSQLLGGLHAMIAAAQLPSPYVLVGHSFGGLLVRAYAHRHPADVAGLILVDPVSLAEWTQPGPRQQARLKLGAKLCRRGALLARLGVVRAALLVLAAGGRRLPALLGRLSAREGSGVMARLAREVSKLPPETHPLIRAQWSRPGSFLKLAEYLEHLPEFARKAATMPPPAHLPMIILSAGTATEGELQERDEWLADRPGSCHTVVPDTTHWIQLDRPDVVIEAAREMCAGIMKTG